MEAIKIPRCGFCGTTENLKEHNSVPCRFGEYDFCKKGPCYGYYHTWVYSLGLDGGLPYYMREEYPNIPELKADDTCHYCGEDTNLVCIPAELLISRVTRFKTVAEYGYGCEYHIFCKNSRCFPSFKRFSPCIPHFIMKNKELLEKFIILPDEVKVLN